MKEKNGNALFRKANQTTPPAGRPNAAAEFCVAAARSAIKFRYDWQKDRSSGAVSAEWRIFAHLAGGGEAQAAVMDAAHA